MDFEINNGCSPVIKVELTDLRIKIDQLNTSIISGLKDRSRYELNKDVFEKEFYGGMSWFLYRLKEEQNVDSKFGRFLYCEQHPFIFSKNELSKSLISRNINTNNHFFDLDLSKDIIALYKKTLTQLCKKGENEECYGEVVKLDVNNILLINERTVGMGEQVANYKIENDPVLTTLKTAKKIQNRLINKDREKAVIAIMKDKAQKLDLDINIIQHFAKELIQITLKAETEFILRQQG
jgi:chorismate mutase